MPAVLCRVGPIKDKLTAMDQEIQRTTSEVWSSGLEYPLSVTSGVVITEEGYDKLETYDRECLTQLYGPSILSAHTLAPLGKQVLLFGLGAKLNPMAQATSVDELTAKMFAPHDPQRRVMDGVLTSLSAGEGVYVIAYSPIDAIPDDVYDQAARVMAGEGITVFHAVGAYGQNKASRR